MIRLIAFLWAALGASGAYAAAAVGSSGWSCGETLDDPVTIDSGSNRRLVVLNVEEDEGGGSGDLSTIGGQAWDEEYTDTFTGLTGDGFVRKWIFNESTIAAMSGSAISNVDGGSDDYWFYATIVDDDQSTVEEDAQAGDSEDPGFSVATGSSADDYSVVVAINVQDVAIADWDTLSEIADPCTTDAGGHDVGLAAGNTTDATTTVFTATGPAGMALGSVVFEGAATGTSGAIIRRRREDLSQ